MPNAGSKPDINGVMMTAIMVDHQNSFSARARAVESEKKMMAANNWTNMLP